MYYDINGTTIGEANIKTSFDFLSGILSAGYKSNTKVQLFANIGTGISYMYSAKYELEGDLPISPIYNKTNILEKEDKPNLLLNAELGFRYNNIQKHLLSPCRISNKVLHQ